MNERWITVVSGLPRTGTSMMMRMLQAGGAEVLTDGIRAADDDNPKGYFEHTRVKGLPRGDVQWLESTVGKVVKIVSPLLRYLPSDYRYQILLMHRHMPEILASQRAMLERRGEPAHRMDDAKLAEIFTKDMRLVEHLIATRPNMRALNISYNDLIGDIRAELARVEGFLGSSLDTDAMCAVLDPSLYRQRTSSSEQGPR